jgi:hypothetical protein
VVQAAPAFVDPVTRQTVGVDPNGLMTQLASRVASGDVAVAPAIPVRVSLPAQPSPGALVFVDVVTRDVLGWIPLTAQQLDGDRKPLGGAVDIEITRPRHDVSVVVRDADGFFDCQQGQDKQVLMKVSQALVAGPCQRAVIHVVARVARPMYAGRSC